MVRPGVAAVIMTARYSRSTRRMMPRQFCGPSAITPTVRVPMPAWSMSKARFMARHSEAVLWSFGNGKDGEEPGSLINVKGKLYGTTEVGGALSQGTVFSFSRKNNAETIVWSFSNDGTDGENPVGGLINVNGTLYGTTRYGGTYQAGT